MDAQPSILIYPSLSFFFIFLTLKSRHRGKKYKYMATYACVCDACRVLKRYNFTIPCTFSFSSNGSTIGKEWRTTDGKVLSRERRRPNALDFFEREVIVTASTIYFF